jgi:Skp family chaperone for outer membrane proteins
MKQIFTVALISFCGLCIPAQAATPKLGAVSPDVILKESKFAQNASKKISDEFAQRRAEITSQIETIKQ